MKMMVLKQTNDTYRQYVCSNSEHFDLKKYPPDSVINDLIPRFENTKQARAAGWKKTNDWRFCEPEKEFAWVCPDCVKRHKL